MLLSAASLAATLGGWAYLATPDEAVIAAGGLSSEVLPSRELDGVPPLVVPLPTLVPLISPQQATTSAPPPASAQAAPPAAQSPLRQVSAPLRPVARTRSSR